MGTLLDNNRAVLDGRIALFAERIDELESKLRIQVARLRVPIDQLHAELQLLMRECSELDSLEPAVDPNAPDE